MGQSHRTRLGKAIRQARKVKGWTQEELAHEAGLHPTYIGGIERGERNVSLDNIIKVARALRITPGALFATFGK